MSIPVDLARRRFVWKAGTALAAPAAIAAPAENAAALSDAAALKTRLALFEQQNAIRAVLRAYVRHVNGAEDGAQLSSVCVNPAAVRLPGVRTLTPDPHAADDVIEVAENGLTATARLQYAAETERPIEPACPLVEMARAQGGGVLRQGERGVLEGSFVKVNGAWKIATVAFAATSG